VQEGAQQKSPEAVCFRAFSDINVHLYNNACGYFFISPGNFIARLSLVSADFNPESCTKTPLRMDGSKLPSPCPNRPSQLRAEPSSRSHV